MDVVNELRAAATAVLDQVAPAVVRIGSAGGRGCGVVVDDGVVVTNAHNLRDRTTEVTFHDGRAVQGEVAGADLDGDLAVLAVDTSGVTPVEWAAATGAPGDVAFAVTRTGTGAARISFGMVSGIDRAFRGPRGRRVTGSIEHTVPLLRGSSGSPLVDVEGHLVAINTARLGDGFYLSVPADESLRERISALSRGESPTRVKLGVGLAPSHVAQRLRRAVGLAPRVGLLVRSVDEGSAAERAGLLVGDLLTAVDGSELASVDDLFAVLDAAAPNGAIELHVVRGNDELDVRVQFGDAEPGDAEPGDVRPE